MSTVNDSNTRTANRCQVKLSGQIVAEGTSISVSESTNPRPIYTVGSLEKKEDVHTQLGVNWNVSHLLWKDSFIDEFKLGSGIQDIPPFDIEALDESDNTTLFIVRTATIGNRDMRVNANNPIEGGVSGTAVRVEDGDGGGVGNTASASTTAKKGSARNKLDRSLAHPPISKRR